MPHSHAAELIKLRQRMRQQRRDLAVHEQYQHARQLALNLSRQAKFVHCNSIACYLANDGEISPVQIMQRALAMGKKVYLPVLSPLQNSLYFAPYTPGCKLSLNRFGIAEPACHARYWLKARQIDLILLPLVAFDPKGNRVGMGGGFYDRSLAFLQTRRLHRRPYLIGLAHELQKTSHLATNHWDVPLNAITTEKKIYFTK